MLNGNLERLREEMRRRGVSQALLSSPYTVTWLTGFQAITEHGQSRFEGGPPLVWVTLEGDPALVVPNVREEEARRHCPRVISYEGYTFTRPLNPYRNLARAVSDLVRSEGSTTAPLGLEDRFLPAFLKEALAETAPNAQFLDIGPHLEPLRMVKTPEEVELIKKAVALCDLAQETCRRLVAVQKSEIELFNQVRRQLEEHVERRIPIYAVLTAGERTSKVGFPPTSYRLQRGDVVLLDICPCLDGYWADTCNAFVVGGEAHDPEVLKMFRTVLGALERGKEMVRPGVRACDIDSAMREAIRSAGYPDYPHHSGHGIGVSFHEEPRITPYDRTRLREGMALALEVGAYVEGLGGIRLEDNLLVTSDGCEVLSRHRKFEPFA